MTNFYMLCAEEIPHLTPVEQWWCETFLRRLARIGAVDFGYAFETGDEGTALRLYADEVLSDTLTGFMQRFLAKHRPDQYIAIGYAAVCGDPLPGAFGGGMVFITANAVTWSDDGDWMRQQVAAFQRSLLEDASPQAVQSPGSLGAVGAMAVTERISWFIVDTGSQAYPFHLDLCAFVTGRYPLCGLNVEQAFMLRGVRDLAHRAVQEANGALDWTEEAVLYLSSEDGIRTPIKCVATPGWILDRSGAAYRVGQVPPDVQETFPAYQSVAVCFERALTPAEIAQLQERARAFVQAGADRREGGILPISLLAFRIVESAVVDTCTAQFREGGSPLSERGSEQ
jgi:hypothetical protein